MILYNDKRFITNSEHPNDDWFGDADYVIPDDIKDVAVPVLSHRIIPNKLAANKSEAACGIIKRIVSGIAVPSEQV